MRQPRVWFVIVSAVIVSEMMGGGSAQAGGPPASTYRAGDKLVRGVANLLFGVLEIPRNIHNTTQEDSLLLGWTVGLGKGLGYTVLRMGAGVYEIVTFPFPFPKGYEPVVQPEYVWQAPGPRYK